MPENDWEDVDCSRWRDAISALADGEQAVPSTRPDDAKGETTRPPRLDIVDGKRSAS